VRLTQAAQVLPVPPQVAERPGGGGAREVGNAGRQCPRLFGRSGQFGKGEGGEAPGCWRRVRDIKIKWFRRIVDFEELVRSPVTDVA